MTHNIKINGLGWWDKVEIQMVNRRRFVIASWVYDFDYQDSGSSCHQFGPFQEIRLKQCRTIFESDHNAQNN
jgi:hypothetical protein